MKYIVVIPARYKSKRLPGKPLAKIGGLPMIVRTYNQCAKVVSKDKIVVATDNLKIKNVCDEYNIKSIITSNKCLTGTDRVAEAAQKIRSKIYINVQGDEPTINPEDIRKFYLSVQIKCLQSSITQTELHVSFLEMVAVLSCSNQIMKVWDGKMSTLEVTEQKECL